MELGVLPVSSSSSLLPLSLPPSSLLSLSLSLSPPWTWHQRFHYRCPSYHFQHYHHHRYRCFTNRCLHYYHHRHHYLYHHDTYHRYHVPASLESVSSPAVRRPFRECLWCQCKGEYSSFEAQCESDFWDADVFRGSLSSSQKTVHI